MIFYGNPFSSSQVVERAQIWRRYRQSLAVVLVNAPENFTEILVHTRNKLLRFSLESVVFAVPSCLLHWPDTQQGDTCCWCVWHSKEQNTSRVVFIPCTDVRFDDLVVPSAYTGGIIRFKRLFSYRALMFDLTI